MQVVWTMQESVERAWEPAMDPESGVVRYQMFAQAAAIIVNGLSPSVHGLFFHRHGQR